jgi:hypothetical protein
MWYFIHIPKCAGSFVKEQLSIGIGHTHNNLKLKIIAMGATGRPLERELVNMKLHSSALRGSSLVYNNQLNCIYPPTPDTFEFVHKDHFGKQKISGTGFTLDEGKLEAFRYPVNVGLHQPLAERYVSEINSENGDGGLGHDLSRLYYTDKYDAIYTKITPEKSFAIVRNPFSWLASYYQHSDFDNQNGWEWVNTIHDFKSFKEFVIGYCTRKSGDWHEPCLQRFMAFQLFNENDDIIPKYIIYKERLYEGIEKYLGHKITAQKNRKTYPDYDYRKMYDNEMIDLVNEKMKHELKLFNYDFEGPKNDNVGFVDLKHKYNIIKNEHVVLS